ncbi:MAG: prepilin-type N-terminal cleavage/methylation domain-containing protein [Thiogranum sp.]
MTERGRRDRVASTPAARGMTVVRGYTLVELLMSVVIASMLMLGLSGVASQAIQTHDMVREKNRLTDQARFAMQQMVRTVSHSRLLLLPQNDRPASNWLENVREETVPPTPPTDDSTKYTAVLAVTLPASIDLDTDGFPDADNDRDGRIDEDPPADNTFDNATGIFQIDDGGDGKVDEFSGCCRWDDEEDFGITDEDGINGIDDDGDGRVDEDPGSDVNGDGCHGICGVDDDGDGLVDEGSGNSNDDEDDQTDEDWYDPLVFYLNGDTLMQRTPVPWETSGDGLVSGLDFIAEPIADNVTRFRVERVAGADQLVDLTLELTSPLSGETVSLHTRVRVGGAL